MMGLKPCPFCGAIPERIDREIWCECGISLLGSDLQTVSDIEHQWNQRIKESNDE